MCTFTKLKNVLFQFQSIERFNTSNCRVRFYILLLFNSRLCFERRKPHQGIFWFFEIQHDGPFCKFQSILVLRNRILHKSFSFGCFSFRYFFSFEVDESLTWSPKPKWNDPLQLDFPFFMFLSTHKTGLQL